MPAVGIISWGERTDPGGPRAALAGMSLSDYLLREIRDIAERPTIAELRARLDRRTSVRLTLSPARAVCAERDAR
jgi:hypothetical protein